MAHAFGPSTQKADRQIPEVKASLVSRMRSGTAGAGTRRKQKQLKVTFNQSMKQMAADPSASDIRAVIKHESGTTTLVLAAATSVHENQVANHMSFQDP